jgi:ubiquitin carboxyl-terminal hydrolase 5/13
MQVQNSDAEAAMEWVFAHMEDPGFNDPLDPPAATEPARELPAAAANTEGGVDAEALSNLTAMGFDNTAAAAALKVCFGDMHVTKLA